MRPAAKIGLVVGGYVAAAVLASAVTAVHIAATNGPDAQAASGMYAFGDSLLFVGVFGGAALLPTAAAFYFLRPYRSFWITLSAFGLALAATGVAAGVLYALGRHAAGPSLLATWASFSVLRILISPLVTLALLLSVLLSPYRPARLTFLAATILEASVSAYVGLVWFLPLFLHRP